MKNHISIIFDFDGTLIDSFRSAIEKFNILADEFNYRKVRDDEVESLRGVSSIELIKYFRMPLYKIPRILLKARAMMRSEMQILPPFANLSSVLHKLRDENVKLGVLTSNSSENVLTWLKRNNMENLFDFVYGESSFFGKSHALKKVIKTYQLDQSSTFYVGDETRDIEAAKTCNIHAIAATWGFNSEEILSQYQPYRLVRKVEDLLTIFKSA